MRRLTQELLNELINALPLMAAAGLIYWFVRFAVQKKRFGADFKEIRRKALLNEIIGLLLVIWAALIVSTTLIPSWGSFLHLNLHLSPTPSWRLIPEIFYGHIDITHGALNALMFVPIGLALPFIALKCSKFGWTAFTGFCLTFEIEFLQGFSSQRDGNIDDVFFNTLGTVAGYLLYLLLKLLLPKFTKKCMVKAEK